VLRGEFTITSAGPSHWRMILAHTAQLDQQVIRANSELGLALSGGPMLDEEYESFEKLFGCRIIEILAITEAVVPTTIHPSQLPPKRRGAGKPGLGSEVRIMKANGELAAAGQRNTGALARCGRPHARLSRAA
jgi:acyl-coenzyme A synthetase/AMP-(fatty) acid ligase